MMFAKLQTCQTCLWWLNHCQINLQMHVSEFLWMKSIDLKIYLQTDTLHTNTRVCQITKLGKAFGKKVECTPWLMHAIVIHTIVYFPIYSNDFNACIIRIFCLIRTNVSRIFVELKLDSTVFFPCSPFLRIQNLLFTNT